MPAEIDKVLIADAVGVRRLVKVASRGGPVNDYTGKRAATRFGSDIWLEATTDPADATATWPAELHNISESGFSFWSKRRLGYGSSVFIREFSADRAHAWLPGKVMHCTIVLRGFLVGCRIDRQALRD
jgi:hypothetical protein